MGNIPDLRSQFNVEFQCSTAYIKMYPNEFKNKFFLC